MKPRIKRYHGAIFSWQCGLGDFYSLGTSPADAYRRWQEWVAQWEQPVGLGLENIERHLLHAIAAHQESSMHLH